MHVCVRALPLFCVTELDFKIWPSVTYGSGELLFSLRRQKGRGREEKVTYDTIIYRAINKFK